ncbi:MAG TPA: hypothetical protein VFA05_04515 [Gaiellaceae bacterium]|nr:hypothetical protein [Gaiellaceae bacterium]
MRKLVFLLALAVAAIWVAPAFAQGEGSTGYIEVCKNWSGPTPSSLGNASTNPTLTFNYTITDSNMGSYSATVPAGGCSEPIQVAAGDVSVTEASAPWYSVSAITVQDANGSITSVPNPTNTVTVTVAPGDISMETLVTYTNQLNTGYVEICKNAQAGSMLATGQSFNFTVTGAGGYAQNLSVAVGACSMPFLVPAGTVSVTEEDTATYVTDISTSPSSALLDSNLGNAWASVAVAAGGTDQETLVTYTNSQSTLKICKTGTEALLDSTLAAGPFVITANGKSFSLPATDPASCVIAGNFRAGTTVSISEAPFPGTAVYDITYNGDSISEPPADRAAGTVSWTMQAGVNDITYVNDLAAPVPLKICKAGATTGTYSFTISGMTGSVTVPAGECALAGTFPYNSTLTISEDLAGAAANGFGTVAAIAADGTIGHIVGTPDLAGGSAQVMLGDYDYYDDFTGFHPAIVTFTDAANPAAPTTGSGTSASSGSSTTSSSSSTASSSASTAAGSGAAESQSSAQPVSTSKPASNSKPAVVASVASVRVVSHKVAGKLIRSLYVRINSSSKVAKVRIVLVSKNGKSSVLFRTVSTNHLVKVPNVKLNATVKSVRVSIAS